MLNFPSPTMAKILLEISNSGSRSSAFQNLMVTFLSKHPSVGKLLTKIQSVVFMSSCQQINGQVPSKTPSFTEVTVWSIICFLFKEFNCRTNSMIAVADYRLWVCKAGQRPNVDAVRHTRVPCTGNYPQQST